MNDKQLRGFTRIVECGSFTAAADDLFITQSALSQQMKLLEQDLKFELFDHRTHKATLTAAGRAFYPRAQQLLVLYARAADEGRFLQRVAKEQRHPLTVGFLDEQYLNVGLDLSLIMREMRPNHLALSVRYRDRDHLIRALLSGECQISIQLENLAFDEAGLLFTPFATLHEIALFIGQPAHEERRTCTVEQIAAVTVAFHNEPGACLYEDALRHHLAAAFPATRVLEPADFSHANAEESVTLLVPSLQLSERAACFASSLEWNNGMRLGVVMPPNPDDITQDYANGIVEYFANHPSPWR